MNLFPQPMAISLPLYTPWLFLAIKKTTNLIFNCKFNNGEAHHFLQATLHRASLRLEETLRPDCFLFLTDGMDTRPYRLDWPAITVLFYISPDSIFTQSIQKLEEVGVKIQRRCLLFHVPSETSDIQEALQSKGYNCTRPSLWVLQGLPLVILANLKDILGIVSALALKGSFVLGELPSWLVETETGTKSTAAELMDKLFVSHGLRMEVVEHNKVARNLGKGLVSGDCKTILFAAEQLQFSDDQVMNLNVRNNVFEFYSSL